MAVREKVKNLLIRFWINAYKYYSINIFLPKNLINISHSFFGIPKIRGKSIIGAVTECRHINYGHFYANAHFINRALFETETFQVNSALLFANSLTWGARYGLMPVRHKLVF